MKNLIYLKATSTQKKVLASFLTVISIFFLLQLNIVFGLIFLVLGLFLFSTEGTEIDLETKQYRLIKFLFGMTWGKWNPCPDFEYISVFKTKENQTIRVITAETTLQEDIILLNIFFEKNKHITLFKTTDKKEAFEVAQEIQKTFTIDILDATESEKKWL